jgi:hypothetical protein
MHAHSSINRRSQLMLCMAMVVASRGVGNLLVGILLAIERFGSWSKVLKTFL